MKKPSDYRDKLKRQPLVYNILLIAILLLALALAAHVLMQVGTRHGARRSVPDFAGVRLNEAMQMAKNNDLKLCVNDSLYVPAYEGGVILDQLPERGVEVKPGRTIYITINSFSQKMVPVPYVAGRSLRQAKNMLEIAGLGIDRLVYQADMATNYVLAQYCDGRQVEPHSRIEAEMGSGITLHVGVEGGYGTTVTPRLHGLTLQQARSRLWELGLNVGDVLFDEGINLLNQRDTRVYVQTPDQEQSAALGSTVTIRLTLDHTKAEKARTEAEKRAKALATERIRLEQALADSLARIHLEQALAPEQQETATSDNDEFFD